MPKQEIDWDRLDKRKFFFVGVGLFSGVTTALYPLTVIKTRQMAAHDVPAGLAGSKQVAQGMWRTEGIRGFYRGYFTVIFGTIPGRAVYLSTLEITKSAVAKVGERLDIAPAALAGVSSGLGGAAASLSTQAVAVPIDVVSQRLMTHGMPAAPQQPQQAASGSSHGAGAQQPQQPAAGARPSGAQPSSSGRLPAAAAVAAAPPPPRQAAVAEPPGSSRPLHTSSRGGGGSSSSSSSSSSRGACWQQPGGVGSPRLLSTAAPTQPMNGLRMTRLIVAQEGVAGLYRGFWSSAATYIPNSFCWWGAYGFWQRFIWERLPGSGSDGASGAAACPSSTGTVVAVQTSAALLAGCTSGVLTNPLDLIKTRLQVAEPVAGAVPRWRDVLRELLAEEGARGLLRGVAPRMASSALWGTAMVSVYEYLKRLCAV